MSGQGARGQGASPKCLDQRVAPSFVFKRGNELRQARCRAGAWQELLPQRIQHDRHVRRELMQPFKHARRHGPNFVPLRVVVVVKLEQAQLNEALDQLAVLSEPPADTRATGL